MIRSIHIQNFESHKDTQMDFDSGVNTIVGESENGKSAILRALSWVVFNRPAGDAFRSNWGGSTKVTVVTDTGTVVREKSNKKNRYLIAKKSHDGPFLELKAFGQEVPKEVSDILNLSSVNFQTQFDSHFLLPPVSPGEVARKLNEAAKLDVIDKTQSNINGRLRETEKELKSLREQRDEYKVELEGTSYIEEAELSLVQLEGLERRKNKLDDKQLKLCKLLDSLKQIKIGLKKYRKLNEALDEIKRLDILFEKNKKDLSRIDQLEKIILVAKDTNTEYLETVKQSILLQAKFEKLMPNKCPLCEQKVEKTNED